jgi:methylenetetrahydrofolate reductase (NADH)
MKVIEHIDKTKNPLFSYEIIPPKRGKNAREILDIVEQLLPFNPPFIDVTSHSAQAIYEELDDGTIRRRVRKKRPGTISICALIQHRYNIDAIPHLLCQGFTREETEDAIIEINFLGIENVMAIRGDDTNYKKPKNSHRTVNLHASNLVEQLTDLQKSIYLDKLINSEPIDSCIGVCGYPEKHLEAPNMSVDIRNLKYKVDAGADYIVTQMFYDNNYFYDFVKNCRDAGITVPIIPGIKILNSSQQLTSIPRVFHISIPSPLVDELEENPKHSSEIGMRWGIKQCRELLDWGVECIHFYVLNDADAVISVIKKL